MFVTTSDLNATVRRLLRAVGAAVAVVALMAACSSDDEPHTLTLDVGGQGSVTLTYVINGKSTTENSVTLPWRKEFDLTKKGEDTWSLAITRQGEGSVNAVAYVDGQVFTRTAGSGSGGGTSRLSGSVD
ncbi:hypothetical protein ACFQ07_17795 [Actinomadura adrarensis]|uniref:MmpS family membrane protein n=1 Tax=Actinomadura adrarensis TaxID=1819600 RepID=A0ABW3CJE7_9ACTN